MHARQTENFVYSQGFAERVVAAYKTNPAAALIVAPRVRLLKEGALAPTPQTPLADFEDQEADFTDYATKTPALDSPVDIGDIGRASGAVVDWLMTTDPVVTSNTVVGYWVEDDADIVVGYELFSEADQVEMAAVGDRLILELLLPFLYSQPVA